MKMGTTSFPVGEMLHMRRPNAKTWMNFDGTFTTEIYPEPIHYEDGRGNFHNIDTDLFDEADFDVIDESVSIESLETFKQAKNEAKSAKRMRVLNRDNYNFQGLKVPFDVKLPRNFKQGYSIGKGKDKLTFKPVGSSPSKGELHTEDRSIITYQDVWNDTDVELKLIPNGLKETFILKTEKSPTIFTFEVNGKEISEDFSAGELVLQPPWLIDAAGTYRDVEMRIVKDTDNNVQVEIDADVTDLVYPIKIDPTVTLNQANMNITQIVSGTTANNNYAHLTDFMAGRSTSSSIYYGLMRINLDAYKGNVEKATLTMSTSSVGTTSTRMTYFQRLLSDWDVNTVTYNTVPPSEPITADTPQKYVGSGTVEWDLTTPLKRMVSGEIPNYGFLINVAGSSDGSWKRWNKSSVTLSLTFSYPPQTPIVVSPKGGESWNALHRIIWQTQDQNAPVSLTEAGGNVQNYNINNTNPRIAQGFTSPSAMSRLKEFKFDVVATSAGAKAKVWIAKWDPATAYAGERISEIVIVDAAATGEKIINFLMKIEPNTNYYICMEREAGTSISIGGKSSRSFSANLLIYNSLFNVVTNSTSTGLTGVLNFDAPNDYLQHEVQLSTNGGASWKVIGNVIGQLFLDYNFINEPETSTALIRVKTFNGYSYSEWGTSAAVFTIIHNQAPNIPSNLSPIGGVKNRAVSVRFSWVHSDPNNDPQAKFDLHWRKKGSTSWNEVSSSTTNNYYDFSGLPYGEIEWRVRTYDQAGLSSAFSNVALFLAGDKPAKPIVTSPANNAVVAIANPVVQWSSVGQVTYRLLIKNSTGTTVWSTEVTSGNKAVTANANLSNQQAYTMELSITNADGLWSDPDIIAIKVSYTPPAVPGIIIQGLDYEGKIRLNLTNKLPVGTEPTVTHNDVYRRKQGETTWKRIESAAPVNGSYEDSTPGSGQRYEYFIRAWGDNGTYRDSSTVSSSIHLSSIWLLDPLDSESLHHFHYFEPGRTAERTFSGQLMEFEGRTQFMAEFSSRETNKVNVVLQLKKESDDLAALHDLLSRRTTLLYRDAKGRRLFGAIFVLSENETDYGYTVPIEVQAVGYEEEV